MTVNERIKILITWLISSRKGKNQAEIGKLMGYNNKSYLSQVLNGRAKVSDEFISSLVGLDDRINKFWILRGEGEMLKENNAIMESNVTYIKDKDTFQVPLISQYAYAGYLSGFSDPEYLDKQPTYTVKYDHNGGNYIAFEVRGDSMDDDSRKSICSGDIVLGCELKHEYWIENLIIPKVFVIVHRENGIVIKEVIEKDIESGMITCHSWNISPEYRDFKINLKDVRQMFYIKEINRNVKF